MLTTVTLESDVAQAPDAALLVSESGAILFANDEACKLFKYSAGELDGRSLEVLVPYRNRLAHIGHRLRFTDNRRARPMGRGFELFALCKDGSERRVDISLRPVQRGLETLVVAIIQPRESNAQMKSSNADATAPDLSGAAHSWERQIEDEPCTPTTVARRVRRTSSGAG